MFRRLAGLTSAPPPKETTDRIVLTDPAVSVRLRVSARARRFTLRLSTPDEGAILTLPPGVSHREAETFVRSHAGWLRSALARRPAMTAVDEGAEIPVEGRFYRIVRRPGHRGAPSLGDGELVVPGGIAIGPRVRAWLRERARARLVDRTEFYAGRLGKEVRAVSLRDTRSRWGSCSSAGRISYSWRLAMAPGEVLDYVAAHECAHLVEMNHGARFWALVGRLCPDYTHHRAWLRREGRALHAYRFDLLPDDMD